LISGPSEEITEVVIETLLDLFGDFPCEALEMWNIR